MEVEPEYFFDISRRIPKNSLRRVILLIVVAGGSIVFHLPIEKGVPDATWSKAFFLVIFNVLKKNKGLVQPTEGNAALAFLFNTRHMASDLNFHVIMCNISAAGVLYIQRHDHSIRGGIQNVFYRIIIVRDSGYRTDSFSGLLSVSGI